MLLTATWSHGVIPVFQLPRAMSRSMALLQPQSVLKSMAPVTTEDREDRVAKSWFHISMAIALEKTDPAPHH